MVMQHGAPRVLEQRTHGAISYRGVSAPLVSPLKGALIGWKVRQSAERVGTEEATATPYTESTGPRDPGDAYRWVDARADAGLGIIIVPPAGWTGAEHDPVRALMDLTTGEMSILATSDAAELGRHAADGFVLYEPTAGWAGAGAGTGPHVPGAASGFRWGWFAVGAAIGFGATLAILR